jgi:hypothetical protein
MLKKVRVRKRDGTTEERYVVCGEFVGTVYPDGSIVEEVLNTCKTNKNWDFEWFVDESTYMGWRIFPD